MEDEILDATLVESDDEPHLDQPPRRRRQKGGYDDSRDFVDQNNDFREEEGGQDLGGSEDFDGEKDFDGDEEPRVKKARIIDEPPRRAPANREGQFTPNMTHIAVIAVVALILISSVYIIFLREDDDLSNLVVNVPDMKVGDEGHYNVGGSIDIRDAENDPIAGEITSGKISLDKSSMTLKVEGEETVTDGYYREYSALKTYTKSRWEVEGYVDTESYDIIDIDGSTEITSLAYRNGDAILLTDLEADTNIEAKSREFGFYSETYDSHDELRTYSSDSGDIQASLDEVIHTKDLKKGMSGQFTNNDVSYTWKATGNAKVYNAACVIVTFTLVEPLPDNTDIESQSIKLFLSSKYPIPVKTELEVVVTSQGKVTVKNTITMTYFKRGDEDLTIPEDEIIRESPYKEQRIMEEYPLLGTSANTSISYNIKDAHDKAVDQSGLQDYLNSHPGSYLVQGIYNETDGPVWNLTYSYPDADMGYVVLVTESKVTDKGEMKLGDAGTALAVNADHPEIVISWAGAEQILKHDDEVKNTCYSGESMNLGDCNFGVRTRLYQPSVDLVSMFASAPRVDYGYIVSKGDEFAAGVDADTGQLLFVATHDGPELF